MILKKITSLGLGVILSVSVLSQIPTGAIIPGGQDVSGVTKSDVPSNVDINKIDASEVPAEYRDKLSELKGDSEPNLDSDNADSEVGDFEEGDIEEDEDKTIKNKKLTKSDNYPIAKTFGKNIFRTGNIKFYEKASDIIAPDNYVIGENDKLSIQVWGYSDYNGVFTVNDRGFISPKLIGRIYLKGLTFSQAKSLLTKKFGGILNLSNSEIDISLSYSRVNSVNIVGEVLKPGSYKIPAINTAFNALVAAGGPNALGSVRNIYIKRNGKTIQTLDVYEFLMNPDVSQDIFLQNGDYIFVPIAKKVVEIKGAVKRPFTYELTDSSEGLNKLIEYAGGLKASAYKKTIRITRYKGTNQVLIDLNLDSLIINKLDFTLNDNDLIEISSIPQVLVNTISIVGSVKIPGNYELDDNMKISDLIEKSEGALFDAYTERAYLYRLNPDLSRTVYPFNLGNILKNKNSKENLTLQEQDIIRIVSRATFSNSFKVSVIGAVRKPKNIMYGEGLNLRDALLMVGGLAPNAANNRIEISRVLTATNNSVEPIRTILKSFQISNDLYIDKSAESFLLEPNDQIIVRSNPDYELQQNIFISGAVNYPGYYTLLSKDEKLSSIIERAGGLKDYAFPEGAKLARKNVGNVYIELKKAIKNKNGKFNIVLEKSDKIYIPKTLDLVKVVGEIGNLDGKPISGSFMKGKRAGYYVRNYAGGFDENADRSKTLVVYPTNQEKSTSNWLLFRVHPKVKKGCTVYVRKKVNNDKKDKNDKKKVDWNKVIENFTVKLTGLATLWIIISRVN